ncbi:MAG: hypothetical protein O3C22_02385 [Bacteroidetes bacterium]|nr:hypothetical protein [Bacteroidota bacterium]MDA0942884.1 hypothetical protein [Bacteroidota bacterium]MDA1110942.1 hypothetical protein [Bacteroidota bacterium]
MGCLTHSINASPHQWESLHIEPHSSSEEIALEWDWSIGLSSNNYLQLGWRSGKAEQSLFLGGSQDRMELRMLDSLVVASLHKHSSSTMHMVLLLKRDSESISAQFVEEGCVIDSLTMAISPLHSDTFFLRLGQSGQSAISAHELLGFYRGPALDWGWISTNQTQKLAFTELSLNSNFFGGSPFVELLNTSHEVINLMGCSLSDPKSKKTAPKSTRLLPGQRICLSSGIPATPISHQQWAQLPHFNQAGDTLYLSNSKGDILARTHYRQEHWGYYDPKWGYTLEKTCEQWACLDEHNWAASSLPGGSPGFAYSGPCELDSNLLFHRLPLCLISEQLHSLQQPPNSWGYWTYFRTNDDTVSLHSSGTNRWTRSHSSTPVSVHWCSGQSSELTLEVQAQSPHLFLTEGLVGPYGLDQSFLELYNPSDSGLNLHSYRLEFRQPSGLLLGSIPLGTLFPVIGPQSLILIAENPPSLMLSESKQLSLWVQSWPNWPSGYKSFTLYLCSAQFDLDSLPWPQNSLQNGRSLERISKNSPWQFSGALNGKSPGEFESRKPFREFNPQISNRLISESQPECEIRCYSEQPSRRLLALYTASGIPLKLLMEQDCPAGEFYFAINRDNLKPLSHSLLLLLEKDASGRTKKHLFRISRLD